MIGAASGQTADGPHGQVQRAGGHPGGGAVAGGAAPAPPSSLRPCTPAALA